MPEWQTSDTSGPGKGHQLDPKLLKTIVSEYQPGVRGCGYRSIAARHQLHRATVEKALKRAKRQDGKPVQSRGHRGHRKRKLEPAEERKIQNFADRHPFVTNKRLAALVDSKIAPRTVSDVLARAQPPFTPHTSVNQEPEELTEEWKQEMRKFVNNQLRHTPIASRIHEDETPIYANEAPQKGRARRGKKLFRARKRYAKKYTLHVYAKQAGVLHWELSPKNADDNEIRRVASNALPHIRRGDVLLWDRLGRSGRARNPKAQHYNPEVLAAIQSRGATIHFLPPKAKYLNPLELLFNDLKQHYIRPAFSADGTDMPKEQIESIIGQYMSSQAPKCLPGFFRQRANGRELKVQKLA